MGETRRNALWIRVDGGPGPMTRASSSGAAKCRQTSKAGHWQRGRRFSTLPAAQLQSLAFGWAPLRATSARRGGSTSGPPTPSSGAGSEGALHAPLKVAKTLFDGGGRRAATLAGLLELALQAAVLLDQVVDHGVQSLDEFRPLAARTATATSSACGGATSGAILAAWRAASPTRRSCHDFLFRHSNFSFRHFFRGGWKSQYNPDHAASERLCLLMLRSPSRASSWAGLARRLT